MERSDRSQTSRSDAKPQKNKAKQETSNWRKRLLGASIATGMFLGKAVGDEHAGSNLHLLESNKLTEYTSPPPLPKYLKKLDNPSWHFVGPKDAPSPRKRELDKKTAQPLNTTSGVEHLLQDEKFQGNTSQLATDNSSSSRKARRALHSREEVLDKKTAQPLNTTSGVERIPQDKEFHKKIILACQKPEFVKDCVALAKNQEVIDNLKQDEHCRKLLSELCKDPELAKNCVALAKNQMDNLKRDKHFMKLLSELCKDPEFALTCVALAKNNKPLDNGNLPLNVTDVKDNLNATQEKAHGQNSDTTQKNIKARQGLGRKLLESEEQQEPTFAEKLATRFIDNQLPEQPSFVERIATHQLKIAEKHLDHTNKRDDIVMTTAAGIALASIGTLLYSTFHINKQLGVAKGDRETTKQELAMMTKERDDLKKAMIDPKELENLRKELENSKKELENSRKELGTQSTNNGAFVAKNEFLMLQVESLVKDKEDAIKAGERLATETSRLKLLNDTLEKENQKLQDDHQKELQRLKDDHQKELQRLKDDHQTLTNRCNTSEQSYRTLYATYQQALNVIAPHQRSQIVPPLGSRTSESPVQSMW